MTMLIALRYPNTGSGTIGTQQLRHRALVRVTSAQLIICQTETAFIHGAQVNVVIQHLANQVDAALITGSDQSEG